MGKKDKRGGMMYMSVIIAVIVAFILGEIAGVILMCSVQINRDNSKDKRIKELEDEIKMQEWDEIGMKKSYECNLGGYCFQNTCTPNWKECEYLDK